MMETNQFWVPPLMETSRKSPRDRWFLHHELHTAAPAAALGGALQGCVGADDVGPQGGWDLLAGQIFGPQSSKIVLKKWGTWTWHELNNLQVSLRFLNLFLMLLEWMCVCVGDFYRDLSMNRSRKPEFQHLAWFGSTKYTGRKGRWGKICTVDIILDILGWQPGVGGHPWFNRDWNKLQWNTVRNQQWTLWVVRWSAVDGFDSRFASPAQRRCSEPSATVPWCRRQTPQHSGLMWAALSWKMQVRPQRASIDSLKHIC